MGGNSAYYNERLSALKQEYKGFQVQLTRKPIGASVKVFGKKTGVDLWFNPQEKLDPSFLYVIKDITHFKNKSYTLVVENSGIKAEPIFKPKIKGQGDLITRMFDIFPDKRAFNKDVLHENIPYNQINNIDLSLYEAEFLAMEEDCRLEHQASIERCQLEIDTIVKTGVKDLSTRLNQLVFIRKTVELGLGKFAINQREKNYFDVFSCTDTDLHNFRNHGFPCLISALEHDYYDGYIAINKSVHDSVYREGAYVKIMTNYYILGHELRSCTCCGLPAGGFYTVHDLNGERIARISHKQFISIEKADDREKMLEQIIDLHLRYKEFLHGNSLTDKTGHIKVLFIAAVGGNKKADRSLLKKYNVSIN